MFSIIVAVDNEMGIGYKNNLLFKIREDMIRFKKITTGKTIIMGRKTFESLPNGSLPNRNNIVLTKDKDKDFKGDGKCIVCNNIDDLIHSYKDIDEEVIVIGGESIYQAFLPYVDKIYLTKVFKTCKADRFFRFNMLEWNIEQLSLFQEFTFYEFERKLK